MKSDEQRILLIEPYRDMIFRIAYSYIKCPEDADDVTQEVLLRLLQRDKEFTSEEHRRNWLIRVTINQCRMLFRSPWRKCVSIEDYAESLSFEDHDSSDLFTAVMNLDRKYRLVVLLYYYEGYSTAEIAGLLQCRESTVTTRLFRAREKLRDVLKEAE